MNVVFVAAGAAVGAVARYGIGQLWPRPSQGFPWAVLVVNLVGCLAVGLVLGASGGRVGQQTRMDAFLVPGFLGGFTTYSAFAADTVSLVEQRPWLAATYVGVTVIGGFFACLSGLTLGRRL